MTENYRSLWILRRAGVTGGVGALALSGGGGGGDSSSTNALADEVVGRCAADWLARG